MIEPIKELAIRVSLYNNRLRERRLKLGLTPRQLAERVGMNYQSYLNLEALRSSPYPKRFHTHIWTASARKLAVFHGTTEEELFPEAVLAVQKREVERSFDAEEAFALMGDGALPLALPDECAERAELRRELSRAMRGLTERERNVIRARVLDGLTLDEAIDKLAKDFGFEVSRERIRQIEAKALRKLRHPWLNKRLRDFA